MSNNKAIPETKPDAEECAPLQEFKDYLQQLQQRDSDAAANVAANAGSAELKTCQTRNNSETHPIGADELQAVLTATIWAQLQQKRVPRHFQLALLHAIDEECRANVNERDFATCAAVNNKMLNDASPASLAINFDLLKLQKFIVNHVEKLLTRLATTESVENLKNYAAPQALNNCTNAGKAQESTPRTSYVVSHIKNKPRKMEDRHVCLDRCFGELYQLKSAAAAYSFYGVFDGHSGALAASYATAQLPYLLAEQLRRLKTDAHTADCDVDAYREAFEAAFLLADERFARKRIASGTTAVCALLVHPSSTPIAAAGATRLFVAWVGDSKALLVSPTAHLQLVKPHQPNTADERKRIESAGGAVIFVHGQWRVNGILNVARSIGDSSLAPAVIAEPDFVDVELSAVHDFLVLGTDGLWDHVAEADVVETVYAALAAAADHQALDDIPKQLIELAKQGDSQDNITVVLVFLKERSQIVDNWKSSREGGEESAR